MLKNETCNTAQFTNFLAGITRYVRSEAVPNQMNICRFNIEFFLKDI